MAAKPETRYRLRVEKQLPESVYHLKVALSFNAGVADSWYSMHRGNDLWCEWKWVPTLPKRVPLDLTGGKDPWLSKLQQEWLSDRHTEGRNVCVIVGSPEGGLVFPGITWMEPLKREDFALKNVKEVAQWLTSEMHP